MNNELYLFNDSGTLFAFTPALLSRTFNDVTYVPTIVTRSAMQLTDNFAKSQLTFKFIRTNSFALSVVRNTAEVPITVQVFRNELPYWQGRIIHAKANISLIEITCDSLMITSQKAGLGAKMSVMCRHTLYEPYTCKANMDLVRMDFSVETLTTRFLTINTGKPDGYFNGGVAKINSQTRSITRHIGSELILNEAFGGTQSGVLSLYPGCDFSETTCNNIFMNLPNYGGFSHMPSKNPFSGYGSGALN